MKNISLLILLFTLTACGSDKLVREDVGDYDLNEYLVGTGVAANEESAKQRARSDLAKIFEVQVQEDVTDRTKFSSSGKGESKVINKIWQINRNISTYTNKVLTGVQIASITQDDKDKSYRAVAILPRSQASTTLKAQISDLDWDVNKSLIKSESTTSALNAIRLSYSALQKQIQREELQKALVVVDITGKGSESDLNSYKIKQDIKDRIYKLKFLVTVPKSNVSGLKKIVESGLVNVGARIGKPARYQMIAFATMHDLGEQQGWYWQKALLSLKITDIKGRALVGKKLSIKVAGIDKGSAKIKLEKKLLSYIEKLSLKMILGKK